MVVVLAVLVDVVNTLVTPSTSYARFWLTTLVWQLTYGGLRWFAGLFDRESRVRRHLLAAFGPLMMVVLLTTWVTLQIVGFGLLWWATQGLSDEVGIGTAVYYSGVVSFTIGFGEIVPAGLVPRVGALVQAYTGVVTTALVIGYLPTLYSAYSARERQLMTLDHGSSERITPVTLLKAWSPDADPKKLEARFAEWERWTAEVYETHATHPFLRLFRSHDRGQHWITALGVVTDAALLAQQILGAYDGHGYWMIRRATALFDEMTLFAGESRLAEYQAQREDLLREDDGETFRQTRAALEDHGFELVPFEIGRAHARQIRDGYAPQLEFLIDYFLAPRGFWPLRTLDVPLLSETHPEVLDLIPPERDRSG